MESSLWKRVAHGLDCMQKNAVNAVLDGKEFILTDPAQTRGEIIRIDLFSRYQRGEGGNI